MIPRGRPAQGGLLLSICHADGLKPVAGSAKPAEAGLPGREPASAGLVSVAAGFILRRAARPGTPCRNICHELLTP